LRKKFVYSVETVFLLVCVWAVQSLLLLLFTRFGVFEFFHRTSDIWRLCPYLLMPHIISLLAGMAAIPLVWEKAVRKIEFQKIGFRVPANLQAETLCAAGLFLIFAGYVLFLDDKAATLLSLSPELVFSLSYRWFLIVLAEEIFYRGLIQRRLSNLCCHWCGLVFASIIFAFWGHISLPFMDNLVLRFPFGLIVGYLYLRSGSLLLPVGAHWVYNLVFAL